MNPTNLKNQKRNNKIESNDKWVLSKRDNEMHSLGWGKKTPDKLKKEVMKFNEELGETIDLKKEYQRLFE